MPTLEALWQDTVNFLSADLQADRKVILWDGDPVRTDCAELDVALVRLVYSRRLAETRTASEGEVSALCAPLLHENELLGLVYAQRPRTVGAFTQADLEKLSGYCSRLVPSLLQPEPPPRPEVPSLVSERYAVKSEVAGVPIVLYEAEDTATGNPLRLRLLFPAPVGPEQRARAVAQVRSLSGLQHRNLPRALRLVECHTGLYLALEEFSGQLLSHGVPHPPDTVARYLDQLLGATAYLHQNDLVHGHLRPTSVLVTSTEVLKLIDTGLPPSLGSAHYAPPEQRLGQAPARAHDLYACGAVASYLATGLAPPRSLDRLLAGATAPALDMLEPKLAELINRLQDPDPSRRPGSAAEAQDELMAAAATGKRKSFWSFLSPRRKERVHAVPESELDVAVAAPAIDLAQYELEAETARLLSETVAKSIEGVCVGHPTADSIVVAVKDPSLVYIYDNIHLGCQGRFRPQLLKADPQLVDLALEFCYRYAGPDAWSVWLERKRYEADTLFISTPIGVSTADITSPIVEAVDRVIKEAISANASDIHMETYEDESVLRYRLDGVLHDIATFPPREAGPMVKRMKILANMDIANDHVTQGGRISLRLADQELDLRVSCIPVPGGEGIVMRLLRKGAFNLTLHDLGFSPETQAKFERIISSPYGMVLACGPTGSGKTTTLYASLKKVQRPDRKLLTVEDPIEYQMPRIQQVQVNTAAREEGKRVTFSRALREFLRQDPDVILVGEMRDVETAQVAVQASLTGHLLLSTLHTNDSIGIIARLRDMGIEPFLIGATLLGGLAQRLARKICPDCRVEEAPTPEMAAVLAAEGFNPEKVARGTGCAKCHYSGYRGRMGLYELLEVGPAVRALINKAAPEEDIRAAAAAEGFQTLYHDGLRKVSEGRLTLEEVQRVCKSF